MVLSDPEFCLDYMTLYFKMIFYEDVWVVFGLCLITHVSDADLHICF